MSYLDPAGEGTTLNGAMSQMYNNLFPTDVPAQTSFAVPSGGGAEPTQALTQALINAITGQGGAGSNPWAAEIDADFAPIELSHVDTGEVSTAEQLNDNILEMAHMAAPWDDGSEQQFEQYMPLFALRVDRHNSSPGFTPLATHVLINQLQAQLLKAERDARLAVQIGKARRGTAVRFDGGMQRLETLRFFAALTAEELYEKINFLGPITQIYDANGPRPQRATRINHRLVNTSWHNRGKIHNVFATDPQEGDNLYFKIAPFTREQLLVAGAGSGGIVSRKRDVSSFVGAGNDASDAFVQLRGFSSREQRQFMGDTSALDSMKPDAADRFCVEREHRAALEWRDFEYDATTGLMRQRDLLAEEGEQEVRENAVTGVVLENYLSPGIVIPVGTIKQHLNRRVTEQAILNAHYDHQALVAMPHFDIYQNH